MSQEKVDRYKERKKNRKQIMKKEKRMRFLGYSVTALIGLAIVGWAGWSVYASYESKKPASYTEVNLDAISDYFSNLNVEE